jgi:hypothetical protein
LSLALFLCNLQCVQSQNPQPFPATVASPTVIVYDTIIQTVKPILTYKKVENLSLYSYGKHNRKKEFANLSIYQLPKVQICIITVQDSILLVSEAFFVDADENARNYRLKDLASILIFKNEIVIEYDEEVEGTKIHTIMGGILEPNEN